MLERLRNRLIKNYVVQDVEKVPNIPKNKTHKYFVQYTVYEALNEQLRLMRLELEEFKQEAKKLSEKVIQEKKEKKELEYEHEIQLKRKQDEYDLSLKAKKDKITLLNEQIASYKVEHQNQISRINSSHEREIKEMVDGNNRKLSQVESEYKLQRTEKMNYIELLLRGHVDNGDNACGHPTHICDHF